MKKSYLTIIPGRVLSVDEFVSRHIGDSSLTKLEKTIIQRQKWMTRPLGELAKPRVLSEERIDSKNDLTVEALGRRSAYLPETRIKFKGCNPSKDESFPSEKFFFGNEEVSYSRIPFGVLTTESVLREILGCAFFRQIGLQTTVSPLGVYSVGTGWCIIESDKSEDRIESRLDFKGLSLTDLMHQTEFRRKSGLRGDLGSEVEVDGINPNWYSYEKAKQLMKMNLSGGFRDLLNSNIGNDVLTKKSQNYQLALCDFDTFHVVDIPKKPTKAFMKRFVLQSLVETIKSSLPIIELADNSNEAIQKYLSSSSLYQHYSRELYTQMNARGLDLDMIREFEYSARAVPVFKRTVGEIVLSYDMLNRLPNNHTPVYKKHRRDNV